MVVYDNIERMWFGTEQKMGWIETPQTGADVSSVGQSASAVLENGGGTARNSWDSHKVYQFSWGTSAPPSMVSLLQAYRNGSYGRGLLYFHDPMFYHTNLLPKRWADPSMAVSFESEPLIPDVWPTAVPVVSTSNNYPVNAAQYPVPSSYSSQANGSELFIPIPEGMTLILGGVYSSTGGASVYVRTPAGISDLISMAADAQTVANTIVRDQPWARLGIRNTPGAATLSIVGLTARLGQSVADNEGLPFSFTNLFTNPSFEAASGTVEIRRNYVQDPRFTNIANWQISNGTYTVTDGVLDATLTGVSTSNLFIPALAWYTPFVAGTTISASYLVENTGAIALNLRIAVWNGTVYIYGDTVNILPGEQKVVGIEGSVAPAGSTYMQPRIHTVGSTVGTERFLISQPQAEMAIIRRPYFDPVIGSGDVDLTASWVGTPNASAVILTGVPITGVNPIGCVAIRSTRWKGAGSYSMRIISTSDASSSTRVQVAVPTGAVRTSGSLLALVRLEAPLTGVLDSAALSLRAQSPVQAVQAANAPGVTELRLFFTNLSSSYIAQLWHGGRTGSPDVWWDCFAMVEGEYSGSYFDGSMDGVVWNGTPNASTSTWTGLTPISGGIADGPWHSGEGHSGCRFQGNPTVINYNGVNGGQIGLSAILQEVGAWE